MNNFLVDPSGAQAEAARLAGKVLINGYIESAKAAELLDVLNPATGKVISQIARSTEEDVDWAVQAAAKAFPGWANTAARERGRLLDNAIGVLEGHAEEIAQLQSLETGHPIASLSRGDFRACIDMLKMFAGLGGEIKGRTVADISGLLHYTVCEPLGVVAAIIPWNGPIFTLSAKLGPALMAGNTVVIKTAEEAPIAILRACELLQSALPPGVINVISGRGEESGRLLAEHRLIRKVSFTGSVPVGQKILHYCADKLIPVTLELGGMNPHIVASDADLKIAIPGILHGMRFGRQSQSCIAGSRIMLHRDVYDDVVAQVVEAAAKLIVGDPFDTRTQIGALSSKKQLNRLTALLDEVKQLEGANVLCGGNKVTTGSLADGFFLEPTFLENVPAQARICNEEVFGPIGIFSKWEDFDEVLNVANDTQYGLVATLWSRDIGRSLDFVKRIQAGLVQVNHYTGTRPNVSYGGTKMSGLGKEYTLESMIQHFTFSKTVLLSGGGI